MNYQKLAIKYLLEHTDKYGSFDIAMFSNAVPKYIFRIIQAYFSKYSKVPTIDIVRSAIDTKLSEEKALIYAGYLKSLDRLDIEDVSIDELLDGLNESRLIKEIDTEIEELTLAAYNKDSEAVSSIVNKLYNSLTLNNKKPKDIREVEYDSLNIRYTDSCLEGMRDNNVTMSGLTLIGGETGGGKSILALKQSLFSYKQGMDVTFISLELPENELLARLFSSETSIEYSDALKDSDAVNEWKREFFDKPNNFRILAEPLDDLELLGIIDLEAKLGTSVVIVDYLQLVESTQREEAWKTIARLSRKLHSKAMQHKMVIITPVQIDDIVYEDGRLKVRVRGSRELENSASIFLCLYADNEDKDSDVVKLHTIKARNGMKAVYLLDTNYKAMQLLDTGVVL